MTTVGKVKKIFKDLLKITNIESDEKYIAIHSYLFGGGKKPAIPPLALEVAEYFKRIIDSNKLKNIDELIEYYDKRKNTMIAFVKNLAKTFKK